MAFCSYSKEFDNAYTIVDNKFITKYLPEADGFAVKVYLYGLFLCTKADSDFTLSSMAEVLQTTEEKIAEAYAFWEDYDLVEILCKEPFTVQYLPVRSAVGRPKKIRYEQYADFNKELQRKLQRVGKYVSPADYMKYMRFLEETSLQPQALLLIVEYCITKQGEAISPSYVFNKAKKLVKNGCITFEQVEKELSNYNAHEGDIVAIYNAMSVYGRTPDDSDYALYAKWTETLGFKQGAILAAARKMKRGSLTSLSLTLEDLAEKGKLTATEIEEYLTARESLTSLAFRLGRKLGVKVQNPAPYVDEYVEKWYNYGYEESSLLDLALFCLKSERGGFEGMNVLMDELFQNGVISPDGVKAFLKEKNDELKLLTKIQALCGNLRKNTATLALVGTWRQWKFSDEMILEAAKRSASGANPIPYMNKILSDWKHADVFTLDAIPAHENTGSAKTFVNAQVEAINAKSDRDRYYAILREKAQARVDEALKKANGEPRFKELSSSLSKMELALAKAEIYEPDTLPTLRSRKKALLTERKDVLSALGMTEADLLPQFVCKKCNDTGFAKGGAACDCYKK